MSSIFEQMQRLVALLVISHCLVAAHKLHVTVLALSGEPIDVSLYPTVVIAPRFALWRRE